MSSVRLAVHAVRWLSQVHAVVIAALSADPQQACHPQYNMYQHDVLIH